MNRKKWLGFLKVRKKKDLHERKYKMKDKKRRDSALRPESSCPVLKLGRLSYSDLANWLGISPNSIWNKKTKERSLNKLKLYANYHLEKMRAEKENIL